MEHKAIFNNERGIALMLVVSAIVLLTTIMLSFGLDTTVNKIRSYNIEDRAQAKLVSESGLRFAMARLQLYQGGYNYIENNEAIKKIARPEVLNKLWNFPFIYPIPISDSLNKVQKDALSKFSSENLLQGQMNLTISNLSNRLNLNAIRVAILNQDNPEQEGDDEEESGSPEKPDDKYSIETQLFNVLKRSFDQKIVEDDLFKSLYSGTQVDDLVNILKVSVSDPDSLDNIGGIRTYFFEDEITAKEAPLSSMSELYALPLWDDKLVELIQNEFTVHGSIMVDLNKITENLLRILIPKITDDEVAEFFKYKNDPEDPKFFNTIDDFKRYIVTVGNIMGEEEFNKILEEFEKNNVRFGPTPSLFKVISVGKKNRATFTLEAYVTLPVKPAYKKEPTEDTNNDGVIDDNDQVTPDADDPNDQENPSTNPDDSTNNDNEKKPKVFLLKPRIVEILVK